MSELPGQSRRSPRCGLPPKLLTWLGRALLVVVGPLLVLGLTEGLLRLVGFGVSPDYFLPELEPGYYRTNRNFTAPFVPGYFGLHPVSFRLSKRKPANSVRIFVLGESAALGDPNPSFGLSEQLRTQLATHYPGRRIETYNLGIVAINSHVIREIAREAAAFEPDLLVLYMGNNEVIGPNGPGCFYDYAMPPLSVMRASFWARRMRVGQLLAAGLARLGAQGKQAPVWRGMETFRGQTVRGNDPRLEAVYANFESNLQDCVASAAQSGGKVVLATVVANYADFAPLSSLHRADFSSDQLHGFEADFAAGMLAWNLGDRERARVGFTALLARDPEFADTYYVLGKIEQESGNLDSARKHFADALHWDGLRFRPDAPINQVIRQVAHDYPKTVSLVDAARELGGDSASTGALSGRDILFEHVHFNWEGNHRLARLVAESCSKALALPGESTAPWLDSRPCAEKLGFTGFDSMQTAVRMFQLISRPPFSNRLFYGEELARLARDIELAREHITTAGGVREEQENEARTIEGLPPNAELATRRAVLAFNLGRDADALDLIEQTRAFVPESPYLLVELQAAILQRLNRTPEAEQLLMASVRANSSHTAARSALVELWTKTGQLAKGRLVLEQLLGKSPGDDQLRMNLATLLQSAGNLPAAAAESLTVFQHDPGNEAALEKIVSIYLATGQGATAVELMKQARFAQPFNSKNGKRLAEYFGGIGDGPEVLKQLQSMGDFTPVNAAFHLELAQRYSNANRQQETVAELGKAGRLAIIEDNAALAKAINTLLHQYAPR
jgi:tetratricopeptide (TPR) repeat protein